MDFRFHRDDKNVTVEHIQDVEPILEWNKESRRDEQHSDWGRHVARIPNVIYVKWLDEEHARGRTDLRMFTAEFDEVVQKKLQDPEWAYLRTDKPSLITGWLGFGSSRACFFTSPALQGASSETRRE